MKTALCMPVGPVGIKAETAQFLCALVSRGLVNELHLATGHLLRARNTAWQSALVSGADRVLWLDADVYTTHDAAEEFIQRGERCFDDRNSVVWYGATCIRRGRDKLVNVAWDNGHWRAGLGLVYWHASRMKKALGSNVETPFRWVEPLGEDYRLCDDIAARGYEVAIDIQCPTTHIDVGTWGGNLIPEEMEKLRVEMHKAEIIGNRSGAV